MVDNSRYCVAAFARVRLMSYHLPGENRITVQILSYATCQSTAASFDILARTLYPVREVPAHFN
jgi:hypothetical protein